MDNIQEYVTFSYEFVDKDDGTTHEVRCAKKGDSLNASAICEMFLDFMRSAGYSEKNVWEYFSQE